MTGNAHIHSTAETPPNRQPNTGAYLCGSCTGPESAELVGLLPESKLNCFGLSECGEAVVEFAMNHCFESVGVPCIAVVDVVVDGMEFAELLLVVPDDGPPPPPPFTPFAPPPPPPMPRPPLLLLPVPFGPHPLLVVLLLLLDEPPPPPLLPMPPAPPAVRAVGTPLADT